MILVVGSGIAGLTAARAAAEHDEVLLVTKAGLTDSNTALAQGGVAAALGPDDHPGLHARDTLAAGAGLCDPAAVRVLTEEGPGRVLGLAAAGVPFDRDAAGELARGLEGAHSRHRVVHAGGDRTGAAIEATLAELTAHPRITVRERCFLAELLLRDGRVVGALVLDAARPGAPAEELLADAVILATGGAGQLFPHTTNPRIATGDGLAAAARAGAELADLEFFQFHPTALALGAGDGAPLPLVSEAVRGAGALLIDEAGERFMAARHPLAELAPRDVVARGIAAAMAGQGGRPVRLDATGVPDLAARFPGITALCAERGLDWTREPIPVSPAAHSLMGGVRTDADGRTSLPGLFAAGEVARTGVHGANRLASNSLLEGLVFGERAAAAARSSAPAPAAPRGDGGAAPRRILARCERPEGGGLGLGGGVRAELRELAWASLGLSRNAAGLRAAAARFRDWAGRSASTIPERETQNLALLALLMTTAALDRAESRGAHSRSDAPEPEPSRAESPVLVLQRAPDPATAAPETAPAAPRIGAPAC